MYVWIKSWVTNYIELYKQQTFLCDSADRPDTRSTVIMSLNLLTVNVCVSIQPQQTNLAHRFNHKVINKTHNSIFMSLGYPFGLINFLKVVRHWTEVGCKKGWKPVFQELGNWFGFERVVNDLAYN